MSTVLLGSDAPKAPATGLQVTVNDETPESADADLPTRTVVFIDTPDVDPEGNKVPLDKKLSEIRNAFALHSNAPAAWVEGVDENFTNAVSQTFDCPVGRPNNWEDDSIGEKEVESNED